MKLIGIAAPKGSGKTTFAEFIKKNLEDNYQKRVKIIPFAKPLKHICWVLFGGEEKNWYGTEADKTVEFAYWKELLGEEYSTPRRILQTVGTDVFRNNVHKEFWVHAFNVRVMETMKGTDIMLVDDVRFENEADYIRKVNGSIIHLSRDNKQWSKEHASEVGPGYGDGNDLKFDFSNLVDMKTAAINLARNISMQKDVKPL